MKPSSLLAALGLTLLTSGLRAQDNAGQPPAPPPQGETIKPGEPPHADGDRPRQARPDSGPVNRNRRDGEHRERGPQPETKPTSYIGVFTHPLGDEVRAQTDIPQGFGLLVEEVMPDSPAAKAGLKQHDVLVLLGDQKLVNQDQLSALIRSEKKDSEVTFTIRRSGNEQKITVKIGEKMMPIAMEREHGSTNPWDNFFNGRNMERFGDEMRQQGEKFGERMRQFGEHMQEWARGPKDRPAPQAPQWGRDGDRGSDNGPGRRPQGRPPGETQPNNRPQPDVHINSSSSSSFSRNIVRRDDSGEYSLSDNNGAKVFSVKPADGEEQTFIVNTEDQRQAIPEQFRAKLRELEQVDVNVKTEIKAETKTPPPPADKPKSGI